MWPPLQFRNSLILLDISFFERFDSKFIEKLLLLLLCLRNKFVVLSYWKENFLRLEGNIELKY